MTPAEENVWLGSLGVAKRRKVFFSYFSDVSVFLCEVRILI